MVCFLHFVYAKAEGIRPSIKRIASLRAQEKKQFQNAITLWKTPDSSCPGQSVLDLELRKNLDNQVREDGIRVPSYSWRKTRLKT